MVTTDHVLDETATLLKAKGCGHLLRDFFQTLASSAAVRVEWTSAQRFDQAKDFFLRHADHDYSFTDCVSFVVMRELALQEALTKSESAAGLLSYAGAAVNGVHAAASRQCKRDASVIGWTWKAQWGRDRAQRDEAATEGARTALSASLYLRARNTRTWLSALLKNLRAAR